MPKLECLLQKKKKELQKRVLTLVDLSKTEISMTLWNGHAVNFNVDHENPVIAVKGAKVTDFSGVSLSSLFSTIVEVQLDLFIDSFREVKRVTSLI